MRFRSLKSFVADAGAEGLHERVPPWRSGLDEAAAGRTLNGSHVGCIDLLIGAARGPPGFRARQGFFDKTPRYMPLDDSERGRRDASDVAGSPRLVLVREPDQLGVEGAHAQLAFGVRLVELAERHR